MYKVKDRVVTDYYVCNMFTNVTQLFYCVHNYFTIGETIPC